MRTVAKISYVIPWNLHVNLEMFAVSNYAPLIGTERASKIKGLPRRGWNRLRHANERFDRARFLFSACLATSYLEVSRSEERKYFGASYFLERYIYFSFIFFFFSRLIATSCT